MAQGERPRRAGACSDAAGDTLARVREPVHPVAVQCGVELTGSPPFPLKEGVQIKRGLALQHVVDGPCQCMSQDREGCALAGLFCQSGQQLLTGRMIP